MTLQKQLSRKANAATRGIVAIDNGGKFSKVKTANGNFTFHSDKCYGFKMKIGQDFMTDKDFSIVWHDKNDEHYYAGHLPIRETNAIPLEGYVNTKTDEYFVLSVLIACHQYGYEENYVITSVPIDDHNDDKEISEIKKLLNGKHNLTINGERKTFTIVETAVAAEAFNAFWVNEPAGKVRWLDLGSRTVNFATTYYNPETEEFYSIDSESGTIQLGLQKHEIEDPRQYAHAIKGKLSQRGWKTEDHVNLIGGGAMDAEIVSAIMTHFPNSTVVENAQEIQVNGMYTWASEVGFDLG
ncbi:plasmid segregation protein ParM [Paenibacillus sp. LBL]|uniref:ParM/StbA family protein n=1 Tax=Paenibacillus sp. LBL TaxID=2940563 RepID=UPI002474E1BA|nr:hypothetical protein [Paenibacillus sp. LBL]MDH6674413.1 plasmid segregation protein ParM [Paenibacillus sp. LBL]